MRLPRAGYCGALSDSNRHGLSFDADSTVRDVIIATGLLAEILFAMGAGEGLPFLPATGGPRGRLALVDSIVHLRISPLFSVLLPITHEWVDSKLVNPHLERSRRTDDVPRYCE